MKYKGYMIDLDGTIYRGKERIPAAKDFVERLQAAQIPFLFLTNNTTKSPEDVVKNLAENHDIHVQPAQVYTPALATAAYLTDLNHGDVTGKSIYIIGELGLKQALLIDRASGAQHTAAGFLHWQTRTNDYGESLEKNGLT